MSGHPLIGRYLASLARELPADIVDEIADGLTETYHHHLGLDDDPEAAARRALAEFGDPYQVISAFTRHSPALRAARLLLTTGPVVGGCWGTALILDAGWVSSLPLAIRTVFGLALLAVVTVLATAARGGSRYGRIRRAGLTGGLGLLILDATILTAAALTAPAPTWPMTIAALASLARIALTLRTLPRLITS